MFTSQRITNGPAGQHGRSPDGIAELRRGLNRPSQLTDGHRQRLLELAQRVARIQALGGEYCRVSLSEHAAVALEGAAAVS